VSVPKRHKRESQNKEEDKKEDEEIRSKESTKGREVSRVEDNIRKGSTEEKEERRG
jgi:hypothetical protein